VVHNNNDTRTHTQTIGKRQISFADRFRVAINDELAQIVAEREPRDLIDSRAGGSRTTATDGIRRRPAGVSILRGHTSSVHKLRSPPAGPHQLWWWWW
jgi:hypothetical protein